jgi:ABC-type phosphate/phosphonate transport system permease subunit
LAPILISFSLRVVSDQSLIGSTASPASAPARWFLNLLRGIDSFVFALIFVAAVGLGRSQACSE